MKRILITGVAGFLGSHLAYDLVKKGNQVIGIDNLISGKMSNISLIKDDPHFTFIEYDVANKEVINIPVLKFVEEIYHLASLASPKFYQDKPIETIEVNTLGTRNMLELASVVCAKMLFTSTSEAYGDPKLHPQKEDYRGNVNTWGPRACYDESNRLGEVYCYEYLRLYNVQVKVARIFNTYSGGLRNDDGRVISNFVNQALENRDITVYGDGKQTRSFCYIDDTIRGLQLMMENDAATGEIINIGSQAEHPIIDLAYMIKKITNSRSLITFQQLPIDDPKIRRPDISKAKRLLNWEPLIGIEEGLQRTINEYRQLKLKCSEAV